MGLPTGKLLRSTRTHPNTPVWTAVKRRPGYLDDLRQTTEEIKGFFKEADIDGSGTVPSDFFGEGAADGPFCLDIAMRLEAIALPIILTLQAISSRVSVWCRFFRPIAAETRCWIEALGPIRGGLGHGVVLCPLWTEVTAQTGVSHSFFVPSRNQSHPESARFFYRSFKRGVRTRAVQSMRCSHSWAGTLNWSEFQHHMQNPAVKAESR